MALAGIAAAAIPAGWIALRHVAAEGDESGYWILVREPEDGLAAWWSDEELAKIIAGDEDYLQRLETGWSPKDHEVADATEAKELAEELAEYWGGDLPQANYWAHGALTRRGDMPQAFRWELDGLTQRTELENAGSRPKTAVAPIDPDSVDSRWGNSVDIVEAGDRWGSHLLTPTLDHVNRSERLRLESEHHPNSPPSGFVDQATKETVAGCRSASLAAEKSIFENYVRAWGGLDAQGRGVRPAGELRAGNGPAVFSSAGHATSATSHTLTTATGPGYGPSATSGQTPTASSASGHAADTRSGYGPSAATSQTSSTCEAGDTPEQS